MKKIYFVGLPTKAKGIEDFNFIAEQVTAAQFYWFCIKVDDVTREKYKKINFITGLDDKEMKSKIEQEMDIFISCSHYEGFCLPIAEAILLRKPVLSYALDEVQSCYLENIEYIQCFQPNRYVDRINEIMLKDNYDKDKEKARNFIVDNYSPKVVTDRLLNIIL